MYMHVYVFIQYYNTPKIMLAHRKCLSLSFWICSMLSLSRIYIISYFSFVTPNCKCIINANNYYIFLVFMLFGFRFSFSFLLLLFS